MAKIIDVRVTIGPGKSENIPEVTLIRDSTKLWFVEYTEMVLLPKPDLSNLTYSESEMTRNKITKIRGLFPSEIRLANMIQEHIIHPWNQSEGQDK